jgi:arsenate reductase
MLAIIHQQYTSFEDLMSEFTIYHNPRCSKSRQTLQLLEENGVSPEVVLYLENVPSVDDIIALLSKLGITARELLRKGEDAYKQNNLSDSSLSDKQLVAAMVAHPKLIERPIVVKGPKAVLGRPPENILTLI